MTRVMMNRRERWKIHGGGIGGLAALTALAYLLGVRPLLNNRAEMFRNQAALDSELNRALNLEREEKKLESELGRMHTEIAESPLQLRKATYRNERLAQLTELAADNNLSVDNLQANTIVPETHFDIVPIKLSGLGRYTDCGRFLHSLDEQFPDMGVKQFELNGGTGTKAGHVIFTFEMIWYAAPSSVTYVPPGDGT